MTPFPTDRAGLFEFGQSNAIMEQDCELRRPLNKPVRDRISELIEKWVESEAQRQIEQEKIDKAPAEK